jgi:Zn-dependent protease
MQKIQLIILYAIPLIFAITVHEAAHGFVANYFGDSTAKMLGRLTLNPIKHIDPIGTVILPAFLILMGAPFVFGWAKPVPINWRNLRHQRRDIALVAAAGPLSNAAMAIFWGLILKITLVYLTPNTGLYYSLSTMAGAGILINIVLMVLNLIPIPPLDGSRVVTSLLSPKIAYYYNRLEPYGFYILIALLATGVLSMIMMPVVTFILNIFRSLL